ncbi:Ribosomal RNA small subunit methyltransferase I [Streptomyces lydicus]|nr:Ribosomal RNA small subunit methyltransferase I [Streptomyces lydicus]
MLRRRTGHRAVQVVINRFCGTGNGSCPDPARRGVPCRPGCDQPVLRNRQRLLPRPRPPRGAVPSWEDGGVTGTLVLAGTPIGEIADAPPRLAAELAAADVIAAEDTRRLRRLTQALDVQPAGRIVSYFEGNEAARTPELADALAGGARVLLVTDAGMPSVSDPGYRLVAAAVERGVKVTAVPGPSAVLTALAVSGLPVDRFCFEGFPPRKTGERLSRLREVADERRTLVYFEAPHRLDDTLAAMAEVFGADRRAAVCRELTKTYEEVRRGPLGELAEWAAEGVRGEITIVVEGAPESGPEELGPEELVRRVRVREEAGERRKEAIAAVAADAGVPKRQVFDAVVAAKNAARP